MSSLQSPMGFSLGEMVEAQRGMTPQEVEVFLRTGAVPDLSEPPVEPAELAADELSIWTDEDATSYLAGWNLTAAGASLSILLGLHDESLSDETITFDFDPSQPRDGDGQWTETGAVPSADDPFPGMVRATDEDKARFKEVIGKALPPAWTDVYIAEDLAGAALIARGRDAKGRPQSVYSAAHTEQQAEKKFKRVMELNSHLDKMDFAIERDAPDNDDAAALMLIRKLGMRPGSEKNTGAEKHAHGATNLRAKHARIEDGVLTLDFTGKKGVAILLTTADPGIVKAVGKRLETRSGDDRLFNTSEEKTRAYMRSTGVPQEFLLKDLRTVTANVIALREVATREAPETKSEFRKARMDVAKLVSAQLGNTPTLALASYINPTVFSPWMRSEDWA